MALPTLTLVDGSGFIFRAFHALPPMTRPDGTPVGAVMGFCNMLQKLITENGHGPVLAIFDASRKSFRMDLYAEYKAHRPPPPPELVPQFALCRDAARAYGLPALELEGYEADDLIASYAMAAKASGREVRILSSDKDLMQLIGPGIRMFDPMKGREIDEAAVIEKFGVGPDKVGDVLALMGDSSDNVPGAPGIGPKTAAELITTFGNLDSVLARASEIKQQKRRESIIDNADLIRLSRQLVTLAENVPLPLPLEGLAPPKTDMGQLAEFLRAQNFKSILSRMNLPAAAPIVAAAPPPISGNPSAFDRTQYECVTSLAALKSWVARGFAAGVVAVDTETDSLTPSTARLVGISLAVAPNAACYIPLQHRVVSLESQSLTQIQLAEAIAILKPLLEDPAILKVGQNLKFDLQVLAQHGLRVVPYDDTMLLSYVLDNGLHGHGMDELSEKFLGHKPIPFSEVCGTGKHQITFDQVPLDKATAYSAEDADVTLRLWQLFKPRLVPERQTKLYETIERPLVQVIADMETAGVMVDAGVLRGLSQQFAVKMAAFEEEIIKLAGHPFNVGSPKQLGEVLFDEMGLPGGEKNKTGWGTGADVLESLAEQGHEIATKVLEWRQFQKLKTTYADALPEQINPKTGRVHTAFALALTTTGRLSSSDPNLQNIPIRTEEGRAIRRAFVAAPGHVLLSVDYSQIELRLLAHVANIPALRQAFIDGVDIHAKTASEVFGVPLAEMTPELRRRAKAINFGIIYGISAFGLARQLGISREEAGAFIKVYFERFPELKNYMEATKQQCRDKGYVETLFGRKCHIPSINDKNQGRRSFAERQAINAPLQGTAADIIKRAMVKMPTALSAAGLKTRMVLQVHDELLFEVPESELSTATEIAKTIMQGAANLAVPLLAEAGHALNWAEAH